MRKRLGLLLCAFLLAGCASYNVVVSKGYQPGKIQRIGVLPARIVPRLVRHKIDPNELADAFAMEFMKQGYQVVDRQNLEHVVSELKLQFSGSVDPKNVAQLGKMLGIQGLVIPSVAQPYQCCQFQLKLLDVETAGILWFATANTNHPMLQPLYREELVKQIVEKTGRAPN